MANQSDLTRKEQVLKVLSDARGDWVDGPDLANEQVGGSEGLKRLRELRLDGYLIEMRKHPNPERDIWQYRLSRIDQLVNPSKPADLKGLTFEQLRICDRCNGKKWIERYAGKGRKRVECPRCNGLGVIKT